MTSAQIKQLQQALNAKGANLKVDGIMGPKTQAAINQFGSSSSQPSSGVGYYNNQPAASMSKPGSYNLGGSSFPSTSSNKSSIQSSFPSSGGMGGSSSASVMSGMDINQLQTYLKNNGLYQGNIDGIYGPKTKAAVMAFQQLHGLVSDGIVGPKTKSAMLTVGNFVAPQTSGTQNNIKDDQKKIYDQFFSQSDDELDAYYKQLESKDTADTQDILRQGQSDFENYLRESEGQFKGEKDTQDVQAANQGVLFSSGRVEKLNNLEKNYRNDQQYKRDKLANSMGMTARDFQYKFGNNSAKNLSSYLKLGGNTYDAFTPRGVVGKQSISSVYNPSKYNYDGTIQNDRYEKAQDRAQNKFSNYRNKQMLNSYNYQVQ